MPYTIKTKDGILVTDIPDEMPQDDPKLKALVAQLRAAGQKSASFGGAPAPAQSPGAAAISPEAAAQMTPDEVALLPPAEMVAAMEARGATLDPMGVMGAVIRGAGPVAMGTGIGAAAGSVIPGVGTVAGGAAGGGAMALSQFVGDPLVEVINRLFGTKLTKPTDALMQLFTALGVPEPDTAAERVIQAAAAGAGGAAGSVALGQALSQAARPLAPSAMKAIGDALAAGAGQQIAGGVGSGLAGQAAAEAGASPLVQMGASVAGGMAGSALGGMRPGPSRLAQAPLEEATEAGVRVLPGDVNPPKTGFARWVSRRVDELPFGPGGLRAKQAQERVKAVQDLIRQYGADDLAAASSEVMDDLRATHGAALQKWSTAKTEVIERLAQQMDDARSAAKSPTAPKPVFTYDLDRMDLMERIAKVTKDLEVGGPNSLQRPERLRELQMLRNRLAAEDRNMARMISEAATSPALKAKLGVPSVVPMTNTLAKIDESIAMLKGMKTKQVEPVINILDDWKQAIQGQDLANIELLRKQIGDVFTAPDLASVRSTGEKVLSGIYGAVNEDMGAFIKAAGDPSDFTKWKVANTELAKMMKELERPALKVAIEKGAETPEYISNLLFSRKRSDVEALYRGLSPTGKAAARAAVIARAAGDAGETVSPDKFATLIKKMGDQVGVLFEGEDLKQVNGLVRVLDFTKQAASANAMPNTGVQAVLPLGAAAVAAGLERSLGTGLEGAIVVGAGISSAGALARAYNSAYAAAVRNPEVRKILVQLPALKPGGPEELAMLKRLVSAMQVAQQAPSKHEKTKTTERTGTLYAK